MPLYFVSLSGDLIPPQIWNIEGDTAHRGDPSSSVHAREGRTIQEELKVVIGGPLDLQPLEVTIELVTKTGNTYYPRMARPMFGMLHRSVNYLPGFEAIKSQSRKQLVILLRSLERICQTVEPTERNSATFGHDIRNLLILACTEVEAQWKGVLLANQYAGSKRWSTVDYCHLKAAMRLDEYTVSFPEFQGMGNFSPFAHWTRGNETNTIPWYATYHDVKHDRENAFDQATLKTLFEAVASCAIMLAAQFGHELATKNELGYLLDITWPKWELVDRYIGNTPFALARDPMAANFTF